MIGYSHQLITSKYYLELINQVVMKNTRLSVVKPARLTYLLAFPLSRVGICMGLVLKNTRPYPLDTYLILENISK